MRMAKTFAEQSAEVRVRLYAAHFAEDAASVPDQFHKTPVLARSTLDLAGSENGRKLPFIGDILRRLYAAAVDADYLVYTNVDIALLPNFYVTVNRLVDRGHDALTVNPRQISETLHALGDIPIMWAEGDEFRKGWDCFVFRRETFPQMDLGDVCIGALNIGRALLLNLILTARNFTEFTKLHLTFHIGNDSAWRRLPREGYAAHNLAVVRRLLSRIKATGSVSSHPVVEKMVHTMKLYGELDEDY
jgi:hypothetical protein